MKYIIQENTIIKLFPIYTHLNWSNYNIGIYLPTGDVFFTFDAYFLYSNNHKNHPISKYTTLLFFPCCYNNNMKFISCQKSKSIVNKYSLPKDLIGFLPLRQKKTASKFVFVHYFLFFRMS